MSKDHFITVARQLFMMSFVFFIIPAIGNSQSKDERKILETLRLEEKYWSNGDIDAYVSLYDIKQGSSLWQG
jgi:hypothetical protein